MCSLFPIPTCIHTSTTYNTHTPFPSTHHQRTTSTATSMSTLQRSSSFMTEEPANGPPFMYRAVRRLFRICLHTFYANVEVEGIENIAPNGYPAILVANHSNSLTDAIAVLSSVPSTSRGMIRMTAKSTLFEKPSLFGHIIKGVGTIPIKRRKDYDNIKVDNTEVMDALVDSLGGGSCVCMFPEGISRYHPSLAPFKAGVAVIAGDTLSRFKTKADFNLTIMSVSINYLHREKFRSDVVVTFHQPIVLTPQRDAGLFSTNKEEKREAVQRLTTEMESTVRSNLLDAEDWRAVRIGHTARKLYAGQLGTRISLGQYVRLTRKFIVALSKSAKQVTPATGVPLPASLESLSSPEGSESERSANGDENGDGVQSTLAGQRKTRSENNESSIEVLVQDLSEYQSELDFYHLKDYRIRQGRPESRVILAKLVQRFALACVLLTISIPGLLLWSPIFLAIKYKERQIRQKGLLEDNLDEIAQYKLMIAGTFLPLIWGFWIMVTFPISLITGPFVVMLMWLTIRWLEDLVHDAKSMLSLLRLLFMAEATMYSLQETRQDLEERVKCFATGVLNLPEDPEDLVVENKTKKHPGGWFGKLSNSYFSIKRRRKKDWNEVMRLHDISHYE